MPFLLQWTWFWDRKPIGSFWLAEMCEKHCAGHEKEMKGPFRRLSHSLGHVFASACGRSTISGRSLERWNSKELRCWRVRRVGSENVTVHFWLDDHPSENYPKTRVKRSIWGTLNNTPNSGSMTVEVSIKSIFSFLFSKITKTLFEINLKILLLWCCLE